MTDSEATLTRNILADLPDFPNGIIEYRLVTTFAAAGTEGFPVKYYVQTLDEFGMGTQILPVPSTGAWLWVNKLPDGNSYAGTLAAGADLQLTTWLASALSTETAASLADQFAALTDFDAHVADTANPHAVTAAQAGAEPDLGNPSVDGHVLSSTIAGARSWVAGGVGGASDVGDLTTTGLTSPNMLRVAAAGGLEERTPANVLSDIGAETAGAAAAVASDLGDHEAATGTAVHGLGSAAVEDASAFDAAGSAAAAEAASLPKDGVINARSTTYELVAGDAGKIIECSGTFTVTLPNGLDTGFQCTIINVGAGVITLAAATTLQSADAAVTLATQYKAAVVYHRGSNVWLAAGGLE